mmetsp:Transcript_13689/g.18786  ORF Transcript_13689/g.18786 Transcript_13689/m.18786 type:complete len:275 (+) Transcript_13689:242-1066(+)|eukprot:CAMPEP_0196582442 /NCGR_PEP_ID=MMETSP1081-20130531/38895_1 /TAXON_ID=36882 /ORGANISM="Pyramimonas amylifera, Strain CCMP720" /LENGTH=274 /DNA_ID=CAMNT_0041902997 /DNA_START=237 /DNA_END=1061 /DNA_ORIENTATION=-
MSSNDVAEIWLEVDGVRLETIPDKDGIDIAVVDFIPDTVTPYTVCVRVKKTEPTFRLIYSNLTIEGNNEEFLPTMDKSNICRFASIQGNLIGFAPLSLVPEGNMNDFQLQSLGTIELDTRNARYTGKRCKSSGIAQPVKLSPLDGPKLTASEGKKTLFRLQTASAGKIEQYTAQYFHEFGSIHTVLKIRYASRESLKIRKLLPSNNQESGPPSRVGQQGGVKPDEKPIVIDQCMSGKGNKATHPIVIDLRDDSKMNIVVIEDVDDDSMLIDLST